MREQMRQLALVTGASSGIGYELARLCAQAHYDLILAGDEPEVRDGAGDLSTYGSLVIPVQCDLATPAGVAEVLREVESTGRPLDALLANAGRGLGRPFLDQDLEQVLKLVRTNIEATLRLIHSAGRAMRSRGHGHILITGSIAAMPGAFQALYGGTQAFLDSFTFALAEELHDTGVTVTSLLPGLTETDFFDQAENRMQAAEVARAGFEAMLRGNRPPSQIIGRGPGRPSGKAASSA